MSNSKITKVMLSLAIVAILLVGGSLAYLSTTTQEETNVFTFQTDITATLTEPNWDPENAENLTPGTVVPKDPLMTNTSKIDEYQAVKLTFTKGNGTTLTAAEMTRLMTLITIKNGTGASAAAGMNSGWTLCTSSTAGAPVQCWYYNTKVLAPVAPATGVSTAPIFDSVTINSTISNADFTWLRETLGGFNIKVVGAAVQADAFTNAAAAQGDLYTLLTTP